MSVVKSSAPSARSRTVGDFTLVEFLAVISILAVLLYVALPTFTKLIKGSGKRYTASVLVAKIGMTRCYAINTRRHAALVFYQADQPPGGGVPAGMSPSQFMNRGYRICNVLKVTTDPTINVSVK